MVAHVVRTTFVFVLFCSARNRRVHATIAYKWQFVGGVGAISRETFVAWKLDLFLIICKQIAKNRIYAVRWHHSALECTVSKVLIVAVSVSVRYTAQFTLASHPFSQPASPCTNIFALRTPNFLSLVFRVDDFGGENVVHVRKIRQFNFQIKTIYYVIYFVHSTYHTFVCTIRTFGSWSWALTAHQTITENYKIRLLEFSKLPA